MWVRFWLLLIYSTDIYVNIYTLFVFVCPMKGYEILCLFKILNIYWLE